jgi:hypothetical protein
VSFGGANALNDPISSMDLIDVYPNPFDKLLNLKSRFGEIQFGNVKLLRIIDVYGQVIKTFELSLTREETSVDLGFLPPGIYFIHVLGKTKRIVKI